MSDGQATKASKKTRAPLSRQSHACSSCGKVFSRAEFVRRHFLSKHSLEPLPCQSCDATFSRQDLLVRHVRLYHPDEQAAPAPARSEPIDVPAPLLVAGGQPPAVAAPPAMEEASTSVELAQDGSLETFGLEFDLVSPLPLAVEAATTTLSNHTDCLPLRLSPVSSTPFPAPSPPYTADFDALFNSTPFPDASLPRPSSDVFPAATLETTDEELVAFLAGNDPHLPLDFSDFTGDPFNALLLAPPPVTSLAVARPLNWAVQALPGTEADFEEEMEQNDCEVIASILHLKEPGMYPAHLLGVERHGHGDQFFMSNQKMCIAYLYPWEIPPLPKLSRFAKQAYKSLLPILPLVHRPTLMLNEIAPPFAFALSVVGAGFFSASKGFHDELSHVKRDFAAEHLGGVIVHEQERLPRVQTLLLYQLVGAYSNSYEEREYTLRHHPLLIKAFFDIVPPEVSVPLDLDLSTRDLDRAWKSWIASETHIRVAFLVYLLDLQTAATFGDSQRLLSHSHPSLTNLTLPSSDALWEAGSAADWRRLVEQQGVSTLIFKDALNALLSRTPPKQGSSSARIFSSLSRQSPFSITILFQTLSSLQAQINTSQRLLRGFTASSSAEQGILGGGASIHRIGSDVLEAAAASAHESSERIEFGMKVLRLLGGAAATGAWFSGVSAIFA